MHHRAPDVSIGPSHARVRSRPHNLRRSGFTLVELMVVVVVVGILTTLGLGRYNVTSHQAKVKEADLFLSHVYRAHETWSTRETGTTSNLADLETVGYSAPARMEHYELPAPNAFSLPLCIRSKNAERWPNRAVDTQGQFSDC